MKEKGAESLDLNPLGSVRKGARRFPEPCERERGLRWPIEPILSSIYVHADSKKTFEAFFFLLHSHLLLMKSFSTAVRIGSCNNRVKNMRRVSKDQDFAAKYNGLHGIRDETACSLSRRINLRLCLINVFIILLKAWIRASNYALMGFK